MHPIFNTARPIVVSCSPHIVPYLKAEILSAGLTIENESNATVHTIGTFDDAVRLNLCLRTANHVFLLIRKFKAATLQQLSDEVKKVEWEEMIPADGYFSIHSISEHPEVTNFMFLNMKIKDAVADRFMVKMSKRPDSGSEKNKAVFFLHWKKEEASLYLDTSGESLTKHGYRKISMKAPLQESLAAAIILATRWDKNSPFINPMCGSGTLAIEAALIASNKPPGLIRENFGFMHVFGFDEKKFQTVKKNLEQKIIHDVTPLIIATDHDRKALNAAKENAALAGVIDLIQFLQCEFNVTKIPEGKGVIIFNPPYGERLGASEELKHLYSDIGNFLKQKAAGYFGYVFTANQQLAKHIGLKPKTKKNFLNGSLECKLLEFEMYEGSRKINSEK